MLKEKGELVFQALDGSAGEGKIELDRKKEKSCASLRKVFQKCANKSFPQRRDTKLAERMVFCSGGEREST